MGNSLHRGVRAALLTLITLLAVVLAGCGGASSGDPEGAQGGAEGSATPTPKLPPGPPWLSGVWLGGSLDDKALEAFGRWRGTAADVVTTYPAYDTWQELKGSNWHVSTFKGFTGRLSYGLPLLPSKDAGTLEDVAAGQHDDVWRAVAHTLLDNDRGNAFVRVGLEANGTWFPWGATAQTADAFKAAYRHVVKVMSSVAPDLVFDFDISCGVALQGAEGQRLASLNRLYPGDDVVDVIGCDHYDSYTAVARTDAEWTDTIQPKTGPGLEDVVRFARQHGKKFSVPEWGLTTTASHGAGDNPFFIRKMYAFFEGNKDVMAFENYFDEPAKYLQSSLFLDKSQNPRSAAVYRKLWGGEG